MIETIKSSGAENGFFKKWAGYQATVNTQHVRFAKLDTRLGRVPKFIMELVNDAVLILGVYLVIRGEFTSGMVLAFQGFLANFLLPSQTLIEAGQSLQEMRAQMERIDDVMGYPEDAIHKNTQKDVTSDAESDKKLSGALNLKGVTFGYSRLAPPLIEDFDLTLEPGKSVAFVGGSGSGKSTLSRLISGLYQPWSGEILFDGKHIEQINRDVFTGSVAVVNQDITLFEDTIANNIRIGKLDATDEEVVDACKKASIHDFLLTLPKGYDTEVGELGSTLSGGEKQRIGLARAFLHDAPFMLLDEPTSNLDSLNEAVILKSLKEASEDKTLLLVSHRESTMKIADEVRSMDGGRLS